MYCWHYRAISLHDCLKNFYTLADKVQIQTVQSGPAQAKQLAVQINKTASSFLQV